MAASYSSFLASQFYSPVFNTALFDGAFRIYFSQSYESTALKIYHLLQSENVELWTQYKKWSEKTKKNAFILIYPSKKDVGIAFDEYKPTPICIEWDEGLVIGLENTFETDQGEQFNLLFQSIVHQLTDFLNAPKAVQTKELNDETF
ncbi:MAG: hypothetical protein H7235_05085 [Bdellovibrionaceae bacterium]|nr:hypothetical protein [Pseudobdellovibrionaceae bacterium]